ncbi:MAG: hypothetical protein RJB22_1684 [Pseudomonadota bacterium]|jgi:hypothetical protein
MARKFLYIIAGIIVLILLTLTALRLFGLQLSRIAFVPSTPFQAQAALPANAYARADMWIARPDIKDHPALWRPANSPATAPSASAAGAAVFFVHPTSYMTKAQWNAPLDDADANARAAQYVRGQASAFNGAGAIWAPRYRQAAFGAFLTDGTDRAQALALAYGDVQRAFDAFVAAQQPGTPLILAGHSQGALHLAHLLKDRVAGTPLAQRIVAAYVIGWPLSLRADLPALGLPACTRADQTGCILSWQSYAEPAEYGGFTTAYDAQPSLTGRPRGDAYLCTNPLTGSAAGAADIKANLGSVTLGTDLAPATLGPGLAPARCDAKGFLLIGQGPDLGPFVLPGNNYHVYDYSLFWANIRADIARRTKAYQAR